MARSVNKYNYFNTSILILASLSKEWEWVAKVEGSQTGSASQLRVDSLVGDGSIGSNVSCQGAPAGVSNVDTSSHSWGEWESAAVVAKLSPQIDGWVHGIVVAHLNVSLDVGPELTGGGVNVET